MLRSRFSKRALAQVYERYDRQVMNNIDRAHYVECLVAALLSPQWSLTWAKGYDWAPWDLEHADETKLEVKQAAARQTWHEEEDFKAKPPRFDIAPRTGYWNRAGTWINEPGRHAEIYVFAWHAETKRRRVDHRAPKQWTFYAIRTEYLPEQDNIGLTRIEGLAKPVRAKALSSAVEQLRQRGARTPNAASAD